MTISRQLPAMLMALAACLALGAASSPGQQPIGYVDRVVNPEDIVLVPGTRWVVASTDKTPDKTKPAYLYLIDARTRAARPVEARRAARPTAGDPSCRPVALYSLAMTGLGLRRKDDGSFQLLGVNRGGRMSIEFFDVSLTGGTPTFTWSGCLVMPDRAFPNAVVPLGGDRLAVTISYETNNNAFVSQVTKGERTGYLLTWDRATGFHRVAGSEASLNNGLAVDPAETHFYMSDFGGKSLLRLPIRAGTEPTKRLWLGGGPDNVHWTPRGTLIVAVLLQAPKRIFDFAATSGDVSDAPFRIVEVDPRTMKPVRTLVNAPTGIGYSGATAALGVGEDLWVGSSRNVRIAVYRGARAGPRAGS